LGFSRVLWFPPPIFITPTAPYALIILSLMLQSIDIGCVVK
jgi:hypothetical protein